MALHYALGVVPLLAIRWFPFVCARPSATPLDGCGMADDVAITSHGCSCSVSRGEWSKADAERESLAHPNEEAGAGHGATVIMAIRCAGH